MARRTFMCLAASVVVAAAMLAYVLATVLQVRPVEPPDINNIITIGPCCVWSATAMAWHDQDRDGTDDPEESPFPFVAFRGVDTRTPNQPPVMDAVSNRWGEAD